jgi:hypothetical protein
MAKATTVHTEQRATCTTSPTKAMVCPHKHLTIIQLLQPLAASANLLFTVVTALLRAALEIMAVLDLSHPRLLNLLRVPAVLLVVSMTPSAVGHLTKVRANIMVNKAPSKVQEMI